MDKRLIDFILVTINRARAVRCFLSFVTQNRKVSSNLKSTFQLIKISKSILQWFIFFQSHVQEMHKKAEHLIFLKHLDLNVRKISTLNCISNVLR